MKHKSIGLNCAMLKVGSVQAKAQSCFDAFALSAGRLGIVQGHTASAMRLGRLARRLR